MKFHGLCPTSRSMYKPCNCNLHSGIITFPWADNTPFWISALIILLFILITLNKHLDDLINQHSFSDGRAISLQNNIFYSPPWCQIWLMSNFPFLNFTSIFPIPHFNHQNPHSVPPICIVPLVDSTPHPPSRKLTMMDSSSSCSEMDNINRRFIPRHRMDNKFGNGTADSHFIMVNLLHAQNKQPITCLSRWKMN